jgi:uncharacterized protein YabN with tetrapyrrole methylase and pyrophosphatase domain
MADTIDKLTDVIDELERQSGEISEFYEAIKRLRAMQNELTGISQSLNSAVQTNTRIAEDLQPITKDVIAAVSNVKKELGTVLNEHRLSKKILERISKEGLGELSKDITVAQNEITQHITTYNEKILSATNQGNSSIVQQITSSSEAIQLQLSKNAKKLIVSNILIVVLLLLTAGNIISSLSF